MILLLGGTSDSLEIAGKLKELSVPFILSVVSDYGVALARQVTQNVLQGRLDQTALMDLLNKEGITLLIDATHPFATEVSRNAIASSKAAKIGYLRFERPSAIPDYAIRVSSIKEACQQALNYEGKIYLTTGSKNLAQFLEILPKERVIARILPTAEVLTLVEQLGLQAGQIEGLKGPFSQELNLALIQHNQVGLMITKESGAAGGFSEKIAACQQAAIPCIVIEREKLQYPAIFYSIEVLISKVKELVV